ncbi:MAG: thioesterase [Proteobacteria bacterium]|nr:thioesterase [Pseudomonadota bacterium]
MGRIRLELPKGFEFSTEIPVRINDINYGGHLGNDSLLSLTNEARLRFLKHNGFSESNIDGVSLIMIDAVLVYKSVGFYGDILKVEVAMDNMTGYGFDLIYRITKRETGKEIARVKTGLAFFDYKRNTVVRVPERFRSNFASE